MGLAPARNRWPATRRRQRLVDGVASPMAAKQTDVAVQNNGCVVKTSSHGCSNARACNEPESADSDEYTVWIMPPLELYDAIWILV